jgi:MoaA/NifB/PqqE/SkfB family radical SAM enzyme
MVGLHVEATSRCTLACPRCERTVFMEKFGKKNLKILDLDIDRFKQFVDMPIDTIGFCGNLGDPIYHSNFLELVSVSKTKSASIRITTNGSRKSKDWWQQLVSILDNTDTVIFSIDGTPENFTNYRINGDWDSIKTAIDVCVASKVKTIWKYIPFKFNENDIDSVKILSEQLGINQFRVEYSDRWLLDDPLRPSENLIGSRDTVQQEYKTSGNKSFNIDPKCVSDKEHFISADGFYAPCCYSKNYEFWYKSEWWKDKMSIQDYTLSECISRFNKFYATIQDTRPDYCVFNCGKC